MTEILNDAKALLGVTDNSADEKLMFYINDTAEAIKAHCRIGFLPKQLYGLAARIAVKLYEGGGDYRAVAEGERRVEFNSSAPSVVGDYADRLRPFVNRAGTLPSEVSENE